jgi:hypothetical protein
MRNGIAVESPVPQPRYSAGLERWAGCRKAHWNSFGVLV